jgi:signal transduction histidine kinase
MAPFESGAAGPASEAAPSAGPDAPAEPSSARKPSGASRVPSSALEPSSALPGQPAGRLVEVEGVIGGLEFTMDITPDYQKLITFQRIIIFANLANALVIFLIHRADRISAQRMKEKEEFEREIVQNEKLASMGRMVAGIAHEIRNPLGIIRSSSELLVSRMKDKDPLTAKILTAINEEAVRLSKTVGEFLDYARPKPLRLEPVDLGVVLDQVLAFLEQKCRELDVEVVRDYQPGLTVRGDKDLLYRAIYNILANAMEAMAGQPRDEDEGMRGQIVVRASLEKEGPVLTVLDTGPGIPADIRDKLTDPFFTTKQNGTGLGLAITANILRGHGAALALGDNLGGGARVDILFPTS